MNTKDILTAIGAPICAYNNKIATRLSKAYQFFNEIKGEIISAELSPNASELAFQSEDDKKPIMGHMLTVVTQTGQYSMAIPTHNAFYYAVCDVIGLAYETPAKIGSVLSTVIIETKALKALKTAIKFTSKDQLRPAMMSVCIAMEDAKLQILATDGHRLYMSEKTDCNQYDRREILLSCQDAKNIAAMDIKEELCELHLCEGDRVRIAGYECQTVDARFPDYRCIVPEYSAYMSFSKDAFVNTAKQVLPFANKWCRKVTLHLNGNISITAVDVDFGMETTKALPYVEKTFADTDIAIDGKYLVESAAIFKEKEVRLYTDGDPKKPVVLSNGRENILMTTMPLID